MVNPTVLQKLGKEHQREILEASRTPRAPRTLGPMVRQRLGWSLIGLGARLALDGRRGQPLQPLTHS
jgi:hypothetical protein